MFTHLTEDTGFNNCALRPISNIADSTKAGRHSRPLLILSITLFHAFLPSPFSFRSSYFFLSRLDPASLVSSSRPRYLSLSLVFLSSKIFSPFATFLSIFSLRRFSRFRTRSGRYLSARTLPLFHFSIVEGKIMYLSAAFLLPPPPSSSLPRGIARVCWLCSALQPATKTSRQLFARFTGGIHLARC